MLPVFQMKLVQVSVMAQIRPGDSIFTIAFYHKSSLSVNVELKDDTTKLICIIVLNNGIKVIGNYTSTTEGMGYKIFSYNFGISDFRKIAESSAVAFSMGMPRTGTMELSLNNKYSDAIKNLCAAILKRLNI